MTKSNTEKGVAANAPEGVSLTEAELAKARHDGAKEDAKESGKAAHHALTDGSLPGEPVTFKYHGHDEIQPWAHNLSLGVEAFEKAVAADADADDYIPDNKVYGLLALERNGQNRTPYVKAAMKRLGLKSDELPGGGPDYTNDVTNLTKL